MVDTAFVDELASVSPTPGGGGASAYAGALAAALGSMVANLTIGKKKYAQVEEDMLEIRAAAAQFQARLLELIDADDQAFVALSSTWKLPKGTSEEQKARNDAMQAASVDACKVPLEIMEECTKVVELAGRLAKDGSRMAITDAAASAVIGQAACKAAGLNVYINTASMDDRDLARSFEARALELSTRFEQRSKEIYQYVIDQVKR